MITASTNTLHNAITCIIANTMINRVCLLGRVWGYFPAATSTGKWQGGVPFVCTCIQDFKYHKKIK
nr:MAG TPA_asm: hypothetical protein [Bacteriophage sp.]